MHESVMQFITNHTYNWVRGLDVLEVGSYNVNGTVRPTIEELQPASYLGIDFRAGPGVDDVRDITKPEHFPEGPDSYDLIVCCEVLEHVEDWRAAINTMRSLLKPSGVLLLTTRSLGFPLHEYPGDYWRFSVLDMRCIFAGWVDVGVFNDGQVPGVFVVARKAPSLDTIHVYRMPGQ